MIVAHTRKGALHALDAAQVWGKRHYGQEPPATKPDQIALPDSPVIAVILHRGVPYEDARAVIDPLPADAVILIKQRDGYTRECIESTGREFLEIPSNRDYWGELAAAWRDAEIRLVADHVIEIHPNKEKVKRHRKGRKPTGA